MPSTYNLCKQWTVGPWALSTTELLFVQWPALYATAGVTDNSAWQPTNRMHDNLIAARAALAASLEADESALQQLASAVPSNPLALSRG